ncbi:MAG: hypothetical protein V7L21_26235 [Nostoc sp.]
MKVAIAISQLLTASEVKVPACSLWVCQIISTKDEFADLASNTNSIAQLQAQVQTLLPPSSDFIPPRWNAQMLRVPG